jgi:type VI secretion system protein ImpH
MPQRRDPSVEELLYDQSYLFDFFQAVRLLELRVAPARSVGGATPPGLEPVRFKGLTSLSFPPSSIHELERGSAERPPRLTVTFFGLLGVVGALPRHYTELILRHEKEHKGEEVKALREWFDLFNHRLVSLFYRAWKKYRFWLPFERREGTALEPDAYTRCLTSLVGLGAAGLRDRLVARTRVTAYGQTPRELARVDDRAVIYYGGLFAHQIHNALSLEAMLEDYFRLPVEVRQFQPQWLHLENDNRSHLGEAGCNNLLGTNTVAGQRVLDVQGRIGIRLGPMTYEQFAEFLPDRSATPRGKACYRLGYLQRLYVGQEFEVDLQLVLRADEAPECQLPESTADGPQLGWNTWLFSQSPESDRDDPVIADTAWKRGGAAAL